MLRTTFFMKPIELTLSETKNTFSKVLDKVCRGQVFFITKRGRRIAELRPVAFQTDLPRFGCDRDRLVISDEIDLPIPGME